MTAEIARLVLLVLMFAGYVAICAWAFAPRNRSRFDAAARLPLDADLPDVDAVPVTSSNREPRR